MVMCIGVAELVNRSDRAQQAEAVRVVLGQLADISTPAGPTPRQISAPAQATLLPVIEINRRPT